jgi:molybdate transport system ATP-binding protein
VSEGNGLRARVAAQVGRFTLEAELDVAAEPIVIVGPNGAGKSSLLRALLGLVPGTSGRVELAGTVLLDTAGAVDVPVEHRQLGYVPQDFALFPHLTVRGNVEFAVGGAGSRAARARRQERVRAVLGELGLEALAERRPRTLSGGEKQRTALARALAPRPRALLLDEPLAALDVQSRRDVRTFLAGYLRTLAVPTVVVTHDAADARALGVRIAVLEAGRIVQRGTWDELVARPGSPFVRELVGSA